jgi:hypothetical protein
MSRSYRRRNTITEQFAWRTIRMLESPAYQVLSHSAHRVLARMEIELGHHGGDVGHENGKLIVTYEQFCQYGMDRHAVGPAVRELVALGFLEVTEQGRGGNAEFRRPAKYRLTYRHTGRAQPTNEWDRIKTVEDADMIAKAARRRASNSWPQKQNPGGGLRHVSVGKSHTENGKVPVGETPTTVPVGKTPTTFDISGRRARGVAELSPKAVQAAADCDGMAMAAMTETCLPFAGAGAG